MGFMQKAYAELIKRLEASAEEKYKKFNDSLIPGISGYSLGVRIPVVRKIAKEIILADWRGFLELSRGSDIYEIRLLRGIVIASAKCDINERFDLLRSYIPQIDNWAVCDCVCGELKCFAKNKQAALEFITPYFSSESEFEVRFACVAAMRWFCDEEHIDHLLKIYGDVRHEGYYVKMAVAWGVSVCGVKFRDKTFEWLKTCPLDDFTFNKAIQKMRESYRVSDEDKELLLKMKR